MVYSYSSYRSVWWDDVHRYLRPIGILAMTKAMLLVSLIYLFSQLEEDLTIDKIFYSRCFFIENKPVSCIGKTRQPLHSILKLNYWAKTF